MTRAAPVAGDGASRRLRLAGHEVALDGAGIRVDGRPVEVGGSALGLLQRLAADPGRVVSRDELLVVLPSAGRARGHAVEVAVSRLRHALGDPQMVQTVVKRGYRLAVDA